MAVSLEPRSIAVVGAGGVGGLLAARLARGGNDVRILARGEALAAIRRHGVRLRDRDGEVAVPIARVSDRAADLGVADIVIVTAKTWQLTDLGPRLVPLVGDRTIVVPLQNGVEASEQLAVALGERHVIGGIGRMISWIEQPGVVRSLIPAGVTIGPLHPEQTEGVDACAATLRTGGIDVVTTDAIEPARWTKLVFIAPYAAVGAVERLPLGELRTRQASRARLVAAMHEVAAVAVARGVDMPADAVTSMLALIDQLPADATASMHRDIAEGRPSELHELIGAVVRLGREARVATPISADLYAQLEPLERAARLAYSDLDRR
jgi:2-dehydropantoate 2-reductase